MSDEKITTILTSDLGYVACHIAETTPFTVRMAQYPDGSRRIQGAYRWSKGFTGGVEWRDLPMVQVNEHGQEVA